MHLHTHATIDFLGAMVWTVVVVLSPDFRFWTVFEFQEKVSKTGTEEHPILVQEQKSQV